MSSNRVYLIRHKRSLRYYNGKRQRWWGELNQAKIYPRKWLAQSAITCHTGGEVGVTSPTVQGGKWLHDEVELVEAELRVMEDRKKVFICPECNQETDGNAHLPCEMVYGRRGWRRLGEYDS